MLDNSIAGKWKEKREVKKEKASLILGWIYQSDNKVGMLTKIEDNICTLLTKEGIEFQAEKKLLKPIP